MSKESNPSKVTKMKEDVTILEPDFSLKKIIGDEIDIKKLFSPENVTKAQEVIETHKDSFLEWIKGDLNTLEECYKAATSHPEDSASDISRLAKAAFVIKSQAGTFGYSLGTAVAKSLDDFCNRDFIPTPEHLTVIRKHIDVLQAIFQNKITGDGGALGNELSGNLYKLVAKYK